MPCVTVFNPSTGEPIETMEIDTDTYDAEPRERRPDDPPVRDCPSYVELKQMLSLIFERHPEIERQFTRYQREHDARLVYSIRDAAGTIHWTFTDPAKAGS